MREIITSLDIGSSQVKLVVSEVLNGNVNILCALDEVSRGVKKGAIYNPDEIEFVIRKILKKGEEALGIKLNKLIVNVNEDSCDFKIGESQIDITEDGEVTASTIQKVLQQSIAGNVDQGNELVAIVPIVYKVDDTKTRNPKGMKGSSLQVKSVIVGVPKREIYTVAKILEKCGCEIVDVMISSMGSYHAHKTEFTDKNTGVVLDIGAETIKISIVNKGIIINNLVLPMGGSLVDQDLAFIYKVDMDKAKEIRENFALANKRNASMKENMDIVNSLGEKVTINQY